VEALVEMKVLLLVVLYLCFQMKWGFFYVFILLFGCGEKIKFNFKEKIKINTKQVAVHRK